MKYRRVPFIKEVIIIKNHNGFDTSAMEKDPFIRILNNGTNLFVNPSWNLGVAEARYENIILANDDIYIPNISRVVPALEYELEPGKIIGASRNCFEQKRERPPCELAIHKAERQTYGFGVFMAMKKQSYKQIPNELKVWYGDTILFDSLDPYVIETEIKTSMQSTTKTMDLRVQRQAERKFYNEWKKRSA